MQQGCSLGLERLGLETVLRRFLERLGLVSVLKVEVSVSFWSREFGKIERLGLVSVSGFNILVSRTRLGLESLKKWNVSVSSRSSDLTSCGHPCRTHKQRLPISPVAYYVVYTTQTDLFLVFVCVIRVQLHVYACRITSSTCSSYTICSTLVNTETQNLRDSQLLAGYCVHLTSLDRTLLSTYVRPSVCQTQLQLTKRNNRMYMSTP